ncbi:hypothetical protein NKJ59_14185 [Mesorhizobium australicum]|uniref:hypothetical protein n=1 Tax=Mesorhizobium australicum TaxID=536018 RepID=UPI003336C80B
MKAGAISIAFLSGIVFLLEANVSTFLQLNKTSGRPFAIYLSLLALGFLTWFGPQFYGAYEGTSGWNLPIAELTATILLMVLFVRGSQALRGILSLDATLETLAIIFTVVASLGSVCGYYVRDKNTFDETLVLHDKVIDNLGLVFVTAGHVILFAKDKTLVVVPADSVIELRTKGSWK